MGDTESKIKAVERAIANISKKFGSGLVFKASEADVYIKRRWIPTGCFALDSVLGGGVPTGYATEIYGSPGAGKTSLALSIVANAIKNNPKAVCVYLMTEGDLPETTLDMFGIPKDSLLVIRQSEHGEQTLNALIDLMEALRTAEVPVDVVVVDSLAGLLPAKEVRSIQSSGMEGATVGAHALLSHKTFKYMIARRLLDDTALVVTNQGREQISQTGVPMPMKSTGGKAPEYWPKLRIELFTSRSKSLKRSDFEGLETIPGFPDLSWADKNQPIGQEVEVHIVKNNTVLGMRRGYKTSYRVIYGYGFENWTSILNAAVQNGLVTQRGAVYTYGGISVPGKNAFIARTVTEGKWDSLVAELYEKIRGGMALHDDRDDEVTEALGSAYRDTEQEVELELC